MFMKASVVTLRYKMKDILKALDRNETVKIFHHNTQKGTLVPARVQAKTNIKEHPFFAMRAASKESVKKVMRRLRKPRHDF